MQNVKNYILNSIDLTKNSQDYFNKAVVQVGLSVFNRFPSSSKVGKNRREKYKIHACFQSNHINVRNVLLNVTRKFKKKPHEIFSTDINNNNGSRYRIESILIRNFSRYLVEMDWKACLLRQICDEVIVLSLNNRFCSKPERFCFPHLGSRFY